MEKMDIDDQDSKVESVKGAKAKEAELCSDCSHDGTSQSVCQGTFFFKSSEIAAREKILNLQKNRVEISRVRWKF